MGLFDFLKKKHPQPQEAEVIEDTFNPLDINSVIQYIKRRKPGISDKEALAIFNKVTKIDPKTLKHLTKDGDLPWGWFTANKDFTEQLWSECRPFLDTLAECRRKSPKEEHEALKSLIKHVDSVRKLCSKKGECYKYWFEEGFFTVNMDMYNKYVERLEYIEDNFQELTEQYEKRIHLEQVVIPQMRRDLTRIIKENPGILQTEAYAHFSQDLKVVTADVLRDMAREGLIIREKVGRTYSLRISS